MSFEPPPIPPRPLVTVPHGLLSGLSVRARLTAARVCFALLTMAASVGFWVVSRNCSDQIFRAAKAPSRTRAAADLAQALSDEETGLRGYVLTANPTFLDPYTNGYSDELNLDDQLAAILVRPGPAAALQQLQAAVATWRLDYASPTINSIAAGDLTTARSEASLNQGKSLFDDVRSRLSDLDTGSRRSRPTDRLHHDFSGLRTVVLHLVS